MYILDISLVKLDIFGASLLLTCYMSANLLAITCFKGLATGFRAHDCETLQLLWF